ncbi:MAG TPA: DAK2 domain-containing protein, partial [Candidatus Eremiobacteraceae bacterium]|nr:DAK2 domain-containing protein [Candidatus Eremiobacteraceae bacterium]
RKHLEQITSCDGKLFADFLVAGTFFLRKYRSVINDLNVFPVPDGDTGTNMFFTVRAAMVEARKEHSNALKDVAAAAAQGSLMGARGNSGVIISQMFRGFAHDVRHRDAINTLEFASALNEGVQAARKALLKPVEGTILSVASGAANACFKKAAGEKDFYAVLHATVDAANEALEKTPEQLAVLKEAKVVDAGGQGFVYFMEGVLRMLPGRAPYTTAFPRNPVRRTTFTAKQKVETHRFCTEFVLSKTATEPDSLRALLTPHGDSLIVAGGDGTIRVHIHTDYPEKVADMARELGDVSRLKIDNMEEQHNVLVVDRESKPRGIVAVAPGEGFAKIFKELGADVVVIGGATMNPSVKDLLVAVDKVLAPVVYLMPNDKNIMLAAKEVDALTDKRVVVVPARTVADGVAALFALVNRPDDPNVTADEVLAESLVVGSGSIFRAGRDAEIGGVAVERNQLVGALEARDGSAERLVEGADPTAIALAMVRAATDTDPSLITLYYGHARRRNEAEDLAAALKARFPTASVEAYYGGQPTSDYVVS